MNKNKAYKLVYSSIARRLNSGDYVLGENTNMRKAAERGVMLYRFALANDEGGALTSALDRLVAENILVETLASRDGFEPVFQTVSRAQTPEEYFAEEDRLAVEG